MAEQTRRLFSPGFEKSMQLLIESMQLLIKSMQLLIKSMRFLIKSIQLLGKSMRFSINSMQLSIKSMQLLEFLCRIFLRFFSLGGFYCLCPVPGGMGAVIRIRW
jgi:hypothetical protein